MNGAKSIQEMLKRTRTNHTNGMIENVHRIAVDWKQFKRNTFIPFQKTTYPAKPHQPANSRIYCAHKCRAEKFSTFFRMRKKTRVRSLTHTHTDARRIRKTREANFFSWRKIEFCSTHRLKIIRKAASQPSEAWWARAIQTAAKKKYDDIHTIYITSGAIWAELSRAENDTCICVYIILYRILYTYIDAICIYLVDKLTIKNAHIFVNCIRRVNKRECEREPASERCAAAAVAHTRVQLSGSLHVCVSGYGTHYHFFLAYFSCSLSIV